MLAGLKEVVREGQKLGIAVGSFNTPNLECLLAVLEAAEELQCSEDAVQQWYKTAKHKLKMAWTGRSWIAKVCKEER